MRPERRESAQTASERCRRECEDQDDRGRHRGSDNGAERRLSRTDRVRLFVRPYRAAVYFMRLKNREPQPHLYRDVGCGAGCSEQF
jgi:hypothetical protein